MGLCSSLPQEHLCACGFLSLNHKVIFQSWQKHPGSRFFSRYSWTQQEQEVNMKSFYTEMLVRKWRQAGSGAQGKVSGDRWGPRLRVLTSEVTARAPLQLALTTPVLFLCTKAGGGVGRQRTWCRTPVRLPKCRSCQAQWGTGLSNPFFTQPTVHLTVAWPQGNPAAIFHFS